MAKKKAKRRLVGVRHGVLSFAAGGALLLAGTAPLWVAGASTGTAWAQAPAAAAKGIEGTWQGTLSVPNGPQLRTVIKITRDASGKLQSTFYSIDQPGAGFPATTSTYTDEQLKLSLDRLNLTYTGKMAADGQSIIGEVTQGNPLPLVLVRATATTEWTIPEPPKPTPPMDPKADPSFDVSTIKPSKPDDGGKAFIVEPGGKFRTTNFTLGEMISTAYGVQAKQVIGMPDWVWSQKFDVNATPDTPGIPDHRQLMGEVRKLMADRFQLKFHREKREMSALVLTVAKGGLKLKTSDSQGPLPGLFFGGVGVLTVQNAHIADFDELMQHAVLDRPIVDQTGLTGKYDFTLEWTPDEAQLAQMGMKAPTNEAADAPPNLFTAMQEELGLKLEAGKAPVEVFVVDKVEQPSAN